MISFWSWGGRWFIQTMKSPSLEMGDRERLGSPWAVTEELEVGQTLVRLVKLKEFRITFRDFRRNGWLGRIWGEQRRREGGEDQGGERLSGT